VCDTPRLAPSEPSGGAAAADPCVPAAEFDAALAALPDAPDLGSAIEAVAAALGRVRSCVACAPPDDGELKAAIVDAGRVAVARRGADEWRRVAPAFGRLLLSLRVPG
jgi:hypothetical protein